jgi:hypothetical protein
MNLARVELALQAPFLLDCLAENSASDRLGKWAGSGEIARKTKIRACMENFKFAGSAFDSCEYILAQRGRNRGNHETNLGWRFDSGCGAAAYS